MLETTRFICCCLFVSYLIKSHLIIQGAAPNEDGEGSRAPEEEEQEEYGKEQRGRGQNRHALDVVVRKVRLLQGEHHGGTDAGLLHHTERVRQPGHPEPQLGEGVPRQSGLLDRNLRCAQQSHHLELLARRERGAAAGRLDGGVEDHTAERASGLPHHVHRVVERPLGQEEAVHVVAHHRGVSVRGGFDVLHLLLLRTAHGGGRLH